MSIKKREALVGEHKHQLKPIRNYIIPNRYAYHKRKSGEKAHNMGIFKGFRLRGTALLKSH